MHVLRRRGLLHTCSSIYYPNGSKAKTRGPALRRRTTRIDSWEGRVRQAKDARQKAFVSTFRVWRQYTFRVFRAMAAFVILSGQSAQPPLPSLCSSLLYHHHHDLQHRRAQCADHSCTPSRTRLQHAAHAPHKVIYRQLSSAEISPSSLLLPPPLPLTVCPEPLRPLSLSTHVSYSPT